MSCLRTLCALELVPTWSQLGSLILAVPFHGKGLRNLASAGGGNASSQHGSPGGLTDQSSLNVSHAHLLVDANQGCPVHLPPCLLPSRLGLAMPAVVCIQDINSNPFYQYQCWVEKNFGLFLLKCY